MSRHDYITQVAELLKYKISGYVVKDNAYEELLGALREALRGGCFISFQIKDMLIKMGFLDTKGEKTLTVLTQREKQIIRMYWEGQNTAQISNTLHISETTVRVHRKNILKKLQIDSLKELGNLKGMIID